jgi:hypothetical protein
MFKETWVWAKGANMRVSEVLPEGALRIVLRWGKHPSDMDSHIYFGKDLQKYAYHGRKPLRNLPPGHC